MDPETLADHLRRATRNFTTRLPEDRVFALGHALAIELARAHAEQPPRHPDLDPDAIAMSDGAPRLAGGTAAGEVPEDLFRLGCLLNSLALGTPPEVSWRLDGPPPAELSTVRRRAVLTALGASRRAERYPTAEEAAGELQAAATLGPALVAPWPLFRGDPARTGARPGVVAARLRSVWRAALGPVVASPVLTADLVLVPTGAGRVVFLDRRRGRLLHEVVIGPSESSPAIADGVLYVGTDEGALVAIDVATGAERFRAKLGGMVRSSPLPLGDRVVVGVVDARVGGALVAVDGKGKVAWTRKLGAVFSSPARAEARVVCGSDEGALHALDAATGAVAWTATLGAKVRATPAVTGDLAVVGAFDGRVAAVRVADGTEAWSAALGHSVYSSACVTGEMAVLGCHEGHLHALDLRTGAARFVAATRGPVISSPVAVGAMTLVASTDGDLYLFDEAGKVVDRATLAAEGSQSSPAVDGAQVAVGSAEGVHLLRLEP
jgi:outer membrane protein assembly factor BamB